MTSPALVKFEGEAGKPKRRTVYRKQRAAERVEVRPADLLACETWSQRKRGKAQAMKAHQ